MKIILSIVFTLSFVLSTSISIKGGVYICTGKYSKRYHLVKKCRGLSNCKGSIKNVSLAEAKTIGRTLCGWED